jgi:hypothetical protein
VFLSRRALLEEAAAALGAGGVHAPRREALRLWAELRSSAAEVFLEGDAEADPGMAVALRGAVRRRAGGEPLAHVAGRAGFRTLTLRSDRRALIPRPETEGLVDLLLERVLVSRSGPWAGDVFATAKACPMPVNYVLDPYFMRFDRSDAAAFSLLAIGVLLRLAFRHAADEWFAAKMALKLPEDSA